MSIVTFYRGHPNPPKTTQRTRLGANAIITCKGKQMYPLKIEEDFITRQLLGVKERLPEHLTENVTYRQLSLFDDNLFMQKQSGWNHDRCV